MNGLDRLVVLVHGGLGEPMDAERFWDRPGIPAALRRLRIDVVAPDRDTTPASWVRAADDLAPSVGAPSTVVAGSNGVSVAARLAIQHPGLVERLVLLWPATCGDAHVDARSPDSVTHLLAGETLRGVTDAELDSLRVPVAVMRSEPENPFHQHVTVDRLLGVVPGATAIEPGFPEPPRPDFPPHLDDFIAALTPHL